MARIGRGPVTGGPRRAVITGTGSRSVKQSRAATPRMGQAGPRGVRPPNGGGSGTPRTTSGLFGSPGAVKNVPKSGPSGRIPGPGSTGAASRI